MDKKSLILIFFAAGFFFNSCSPFYKFDELYDQGKYLEAFSILKEIKTTNSLQYQKRAYRAIIRLSLQGDEDFIKKLGNTVTNFTAKDFLTYSNFSSTYLTFLNTPLSDQKQFLIIISNFQNDHYIPDDFKPEALQLRGLSRFKIGDYENAILDFHDSFRLAPFIDNYYFIGVCYSELEKYNEAFSFFNKVIEISDNPFLAGLSFYQKGEILYYQEKYESALNDYMQAIQYYPNSANFNFKIGKCLQKMGYNNLAPHFFRISLRIQNNFANAWYFLNIN